MMLDFNPRRLNFLDPFALSDRIDVVEDIETIRAILSLPTHQAGDIKSKRGTPVSMTVTALNSLASSSSFLAGWTSAWVDDTAVNALDYEVSGEIKAGASPTAGSVRVYAYALHADLAGTAPNIFSSGTPGTQGAASVTDTEQLDASLVLLWSSDIDTTTNDIYAMPNRSIAQAFGFVPLKWALFCAHNTVQTLAASGNAFYYTPRLGQYT